MESKENVCLNQRSYRILLSFLLFVKKVLKLTRNFLPDFSLLLLTNVSALYIVQQEIKVKKFFFGDMLPGLCFSNLFCFENFFLVGCDRFYTPAPKAVFNTPLASSAEWETQVLFSK
jgi:hypothetical protein